MTARDRRRSVYLRELVRLFAEEEYNLHASRMQALEVVRRREPVRQKRLGALIPSCAALVLVCGAAILGPVHFSVAVGMITVCILGWVVWQIACLSSPEGASHLGSRASRLPWIQAYLRRAAEEWGRCDEDE